MEETFWNDIIDCLSKATGRVASSLHLPRNISEDIVADAVLDSARFIISGKFKRRCQVKTLFYMIVSRRMIDFIRREIKEKKGNLTVFEFQCYYIDDFIKRFEQRELLRIHIKEGNKPHKKKKRPWHRTFQNFYNESPCKVKLPWWEYLSYSFKAF